MHTMLCIKHGSLGTTGPRTISRCSGTVLRDCTITRYFIGSGIIAPSYSTDVSAIPFPAGFPKFVIEDSK